MVTYAHRKTNRAWAEVSRETRWETTCCRLRSFIHTPSNKRRTRSNTTLASARELHRNWHCVSAHQTTQHIVSECPLHSCNGDLVTLNTAALNWFHDLQWDVYRTILNQTEEEQIISKQCTAAVIYEWNRCQFKPHEAQLDQPRD